MNEILRILEYMAPLTISLLCLFLLAGYYYFPPRNAVTDKKLLQVMMLYYGAMVVNWISPLLYIYAPEFYVYETVFYFFCLLITQVTFYHLVYLLTGTGGKNDFPAIHYAVAGVLGLFFTVWSLTVPYEVRLALVTSGGEMQAGYEAYSFLSTYRIELRGLYTLFYVVLGFRRFRRYRKTVGEYSADNQRSLLRWLYLLILLSLSFVPMPLGALFFSAQGLFYSIVPMVSVPVYVIQYILLCYNILVGNYVIISPEKEKQATKTPCRLDKKHFETYLRTEKPWLNPKLKITDLTLPLITNRTYLSTFINKEYGMNFSRYINTLRLEELERLRTDSRYDRLSEIDLILSAGFSSYYSFRNFLVSEQKLKKRPFIK